MSFLHDIADLLSRATGIGWHHPPAITDTAAYRELEAQTESLQREACELTAEARYYDANAWQYRRRVL